MTKAVDLLKNKFGVSQLYKYELKDENGEVILQIFWHPLTIAEREMIQKKSGTEDANDFALQLMIEIPSLKNQMGMVFSEIIEINNTQSSGPQIFTFSIDNYSFDLSESVNQIQVNYSSQIIDFLSNESNK